MGRFIEPEAPDGYSPAAPADKTIQAEPTGLALGNKNVPQSRSWYLSLATDNFGVRAYGYTTRLYYSFLFAI